METRTILAFMRYAYLALLLSALTTISNASDWLTLKSTYSHDPNSCQRVSQYTAIENPTTTTVPNFRTSGYTHTRSRLGFAGSADNYHRVEEWGDPVRPYGEWKRPFRPGSVPYALWGAPYAGMNSFYGGDRGFGGNQHGYGGNRGDDHGGQHGHSDGYQGHHPNGPPAPITDPPSTDD